jgi:rubrerythrin
MRPSAKESIMNVFDFAIDMERQGRDFYQQQAQSAEREGIRKIFQMMANDEQQMIESLRKLRAATRQPEKVESSALTRLRNLYKSGLLREQASHLADDLEAYRFAIEAQSRLQTLYETAARNEENTQARRLLLQIAQEEAREVESLQKLYDFVNAPNEFLAWREFSNLDEFHNFGRYEDGRPED